MAENRETNTDLTNEEALLATIDEARGAVESSYDEFRSAYLKLQASYKKHLKIKSKAEAKPSARNLAKLQLSKQELSIVLKNFKSAEKKANDALIAYERAQEKYADYQISIGNKREAKRILRASERYLKSAEKKNERIVTLASDTVSAYELEAEMSDSVTDSDYESQTADSVASRQQSTAQQQRYEAPPHMYPPYYDPYMARPGISIAPVNVDVSAMVESAVKETVAKLQQALDARLAEYIAALRLPEINLNATAQQEAPQAEPATPVAEAPVTEPVAEDVPVAEEPVEEAPVTEAQTTEPEQPEAPQTVESEQSEEPAEAPTVNEPVAAPAAQPASAPTATYTTSDVESVSALTTTLDALLAEIAKLTERAEALAETQRATNEMLRNSAREAQGIQVKQRLVNQEQEALVEAQAAIVEGNKMLAEKQQRIAEQQQATSETVATIIESQHNIDSALKASIQLQKTLIQSNTKNAELLTKQIAQANAMREAIPTARGRKPSAKKPQTEEIVTEENQDSTEQ
ncbi:MAG: hypothetical protein IJ515_05225 [Clostridia bacterium]|nr:hypothetical protein [Clostridia bacterium]